MSFALQRKDVTRLSGLMVQNAAVEEERHESAITREQLKCLVIGGYFMSNVSIGILLDEFQINSPKDYFKLDVKDRAIFLSRIKSSAQQATNDVLTEVECTPGLKMHFQVRHLSPGNWQNIPNETFARKLAFFASKSIITFPFNQLAYREKDIYSILELLCAARPFLREGFVSILPSDDRLEKKLRNKKYGLVSANFQLQRLETQFEEPALIANLYLPYFRDIAPQDVIRLRHEEKLLYEGFEHRLAGLLCGTKKINEKTLLKELENIDQHIRELTIRFEAIRDESRKKDIEMLLGTATVGLALLFTPIGPLAAFLGSFPFWDYVKFKLEAPSRAKAQKAEEYYLLWKLSILKGFNRARKNQAAYMPHETRKDAFH